MPKGGYRPSAPQNNPMNVNALGGNGQSGTQAAKRIAAGKYGEGKKLLETQRSAPMAATQPVSMPSAASMGGMNLPPITPLTAPTERPNEPLTTGLPFGPGAGPEVLGGNQPQESLSQVLSQIVQYDTSGELSDLYEYLLSRGL